MQLLGIRKPMAECPGSPLVYNCRLLGQVPANHRFRALKLARFRAHGLKVRSYKWLGGSIISAECACAGFQDEIHALFYCTCFEVCDSALVGGHSDVTLTYSIVAGSLT
eukprot:1158731-Pelagomonas_calceolata.AAC.4